MKECNTQVHEYAAYLDDLRDRLDKEDVIIEYLQDLWYSIAPEWPSPPADILADALRDYGPYTVEYAIRATAKACVRGTYDPSRAKLGYYFIGVCRNHDEWQ